LEGVPEERRKIIADSFVLEGGVSSAASASPAS
jgi:hypothetical protein